MSHLKNTFTKAVCVGAGIAVGAVSERYGGIPSQEIVSAAKDFATIGTMATTGAFMGGVVLDPVIRQMNAAANRWGI